MSSFWIVLELKVMEVVVTGAVRHAKFQSNRHHQQTNTQLFTGRMSFLSPNQQCKSTEGKFFLTNSRLFSSDTQFRSVELSRTQKLLTSSLVVRLHAARNVWNPASPSTDHMEKNATTATSRVNNGRQGNASHIRRVRYQTTFVLSHH